MFFSLNYIFLTVCITIQKYEFKRSKKTARETSKQICIERKRERQTSKLRKREAVRYREKIERQTCIERKRERQTGTEKTDRERKRETDRYREKIDRQTGIDRK